jgi:hypothetical protein
MGVKPLIQQQILSISNEKTQQERNQSTNLFIKKDPLMRYPQDFHIPLYNCKGLLMKGMGKRKMNVSAQIRTCVLYTACG